MCLGYQAISNKNSQNLFYFGFAFVFGFSKCLQYSESLISTWKERKGKSFLSIDAFYKILFLLL